jgi:large subunit ribosomal protein L2
LRQVEWNRRQFDIPAKVVAIEYDPGRTADLALIVYQNGSKAYILATTNMQVGDTVISAETAPIKDGNCLPLKNIPVGVPIHALSFQVGKPSQLIKSAGSAAYVQSIDGNKALVKLPSGEIRIFNSECRATIGQVSNSDHSNQKLTKLVKCVTVVFVQLSVVLPRILILIHTAEVKVVVLLVCIQKLSGVNQPSEELEKLKKPLIN